MAWTDKPTEAQLGALFSLMRWKVPSEKLTTAIDYLRDNKTRKEVSDELTRVRNLYVSHKLTADNCFASKIWEKMEVSSGGKVQG